MVGVSHLYDFLESVILVLAFRMKNRPILEDRKEKINRKTGKEEHDSAGALEMTLKIIQDEGQRRF